MWETQTRSSKRPYSEEDLSDAEHSDDESWGDLTKKTNRPGVAENYPLSKRPKLLLGSSDQPYAPGVIPSSASAAPHSSEAPCSDLPNLLPPTMRSLVPTIAVQDSDADNYATAVNDPRLPKPPYHWRPPSLEGSGLPLGFSRIDLTDLRNRASDFGNTTPAALPLGTPSCALPISRQSTHQEHSAQTCQNLSRGLVTPNPQFNGSQYQKVSGGSEFRQTSQSDGLNLNTGGVSPARLSEQHHPSRYLGQDPGGEFSFATYSSPSGLVGTDCPDVCLAIHEKATADGSQLEVVPIFPLTAAGESKHSEEYRSRTNEMSGMIALWMDEERERRNPASFLSSSPSYSKYTDPTAQISDRRLVAGVSDISKQQDMTKLYLRIVQSSVPIEDLKGKHFESLDNGLFKRRTTFDMTSVEWPVYASNTAESGDIAVTCHSAQV